MVADDETVPVSEAAREIALRFALPGRYDGISSYATCRGDADKKPYMLAIAAALTTPAAPANGGVPDGWRLVPVEPTQKMVEAGDKLTGYWSVNDGYQETDSAAACWAAMLAATPPLPEQPTAAHRTEREAVERAAQEMWISEDKPGSLDDSGRRGEFERLAYAAIRVLTPPDRVAQSEDKA